MKSMYRHFFASCIAYADMGACIREEIISLPFLPVHILSANMKDAHKEEGTEDQAEKSHDSRNHCHEWLKIIALLSNGFNIVSQFLYLF